MNPAALVAKLITEKAELRDEVKSLSLENDSLRLRLNMRDARSTPSGVTARDILELIKEAHPDKNGGHPLATKITQMLNALRDRLL
ncbi:MAG: hypothetical protein ACREJT_16295 [Myxococcota bacterium]